MIELVGQVVEERRQVHGRQVCADAGRQRLDEEKERLLRHGIEVVQRVEHEGGAVGCEAARSGVVHSLCHRVRVGAGHDEGHEAVDRVLRQRVEDG